MSSLRVALALLAAACAAVLVHGYHLGADDAAIYIPAIKQAADPALYPFGSAFFETQAGWSAAPKLIGGSARLLHVPVDGAILAWHIASVFLFLLAVWRLQCACFESSAARWGGVLLVAACLTVPVAGTALVIMDPYVTARSLAAPTAVFAVAEWLSGRKWLAALWIAATAAIHPQMSVYAAALLGVLAVGSSVFGLLPFGYGFEPTQGPAREALLARTYFFVNRWEWYEWVGAIAPLGILAWLATMRPRGATGAFRRIARALAVYGVLFTAAAVALVLSPRLETFNRLQPMRAFHLLYCIFFALLGGLIGEYVLGRKLWRWAALFVPLAGGMWFAQAGAYPSSPHVEWPGDSGGNPWLDACYWIRAHTPMDARFALDPDYFSMPQVDQHGFRAVAERSVLADRLKDSGPVALFPELAGEWKREVAAQSGWQGFGTADFLNLNRLYGVTWVVTRSPDPAFEDCPFRAGEFAVCHLDGL